MYLWKPKHEQRAITVLSLKLAFTCAGRIAVDGNRKRIYIPVIKHLRLLGVIFNTDVQFVCVLKWGTEGQRLQRWDVTETK
jgi:hypothetical protein